MGVLARTIAVIDDDARVLESLQNLLASFGYKAETYSSAELFLMSYHRCRDEADERLRTASACQKHEDLLLLTKPPVICSGDFSK
jgi:FixJ family two-component response regulator